jgi:hypothetical protein
VTGVARSWLRPDDAAGALALATAARAATPWLVLLACATAVAVPLLAAAVRRAAWARVVVLVAALFVIWTATFDARLHPAIARERSLSAFLAKVKRMVPPDTPLYALFPPDPGLRFYAPRTLRAWPAEGGLPGSYLLLWEDEWQRLRDGSGRPLPVLAVSDARRTGRGQLALVSTPRGPLAPATESVGPPAPLGLRTGSRPR